MAMRRFAGGHVGDVDPVDEALPGGDFLEPGDHSEQRRLSAARGAEESGERSLVDGEAEIVDRGHRAIALRHPAQLDMRRRRWRFLRLVIP